MNAFKAPKVSIGIPVYNGEKYLRAALDSLVNQTYTDIEIVISDNASTDGTEEICRSFASSDPRIRYHRNTENIGAGANYRQVFSMCRGAYFKWAAHDDTYADTFIERCVRVLDSRPEILLAYSYTILIDENGLEIDKYKDPFNMDCDLESVRFKDILFNLGWCHAVFGLMRRDILAQTALTGSYLASDMILLAELAMLGRFAEISDHLFSRRLHSGASGQANADPQSLAIWYDPANKGRRQLKRTKMFMEYLRAIRRVRIPAREKLGCYFHVLRWGMLWRREVGAELWLAVVGPGK